MRILLFFKIIQQRLSRELEQRKILEVVEVESTDDDDGDEVVDLEPDTAGSSLAKKIRVRIIEVTITWLILILWLD